MEQRGVGVVAGRPNGTPDGGSRVAAIQICNLPVPAQIVVGREILRTAALKAAVRSESECAGDKLTVNPVPRGWGQNARDPFRLRLRALRRSRLAVCWVADW